MKKLAEGKTKIIYDADNNNVMIFSKDFITAGDGSKRDFIKGKGAVATRTAANVFQFLNKRGIPTHFLKRVNDLRLLCLRCDMIPLEVTIRGSAAGHFLKRHPDMKEGVDFTEPVVEFAFKDDARHDPFVIITAEGSWTLHDAEHPVTSDTLIEEIEPLLSSKEVHLVHEIAKKVFRVLKSVWEMLDVKLIDLKIEFGRTKDGRIVVGDVIDNDSWRLWPGGEKSHQMDKQIYREGGNLDEVLRNYKMVAEMTALF